VRSSRLSHVKRSRIIAKPLIVASACGSGLRRCIPTPPPCRLLCQIITTCAPPPMAATARGWRRPQHMTAVHLVSSLYVLRSPSNGFRDCLLDVVRFTSSKRSCVVPCHTKEEEKARRRCPHRHALRRYKPVPLCWGR
jgi:hypothetical protein